MLLYVRRAGQRLATTLYYCLIMVPRHIRGGNSLKRVCPALRPPPAVRLIVERLRCPMPPGAGDRQGHTQRVLAHRAMVDTTAGLLKVGLRRSFPHTAAMGQRYMEHSRLPLQFFYVLSYSSLDHPGKGVQYLVMLGRRQGKRKNIMGGTDARAGLDSSCCLSCRRRAKGEDATGAAPSRSAP